MLDQSKHINLDGKSQTLYRQLKLVLFGATILFLIYLFYSIAFPTKKFEFFFNSPNSLKNTISDPRTNDGLVMDKRIPTAKDLFFDTSVSGNFSYVVVNFNLTDNLSLDQKKLFFNKSYRAFLYPEGEVADIPDGALIKNGNDYYIAFENTLKKFSSPNIAQLLGFNEESFLKINETNFPYKISAEKITDSKNYPNGTIFKINDSYYQLKNDILHKFISEKAFLTNYNQSQAISKDQSFLEKYTLAEDFLGFSDGSLISSKESVFIVDGKIKHPLINIQTFESMGFDWSDVISATSEELEIYEKSKLFDMSQPHTNGTIFFDQDTEKYYLIKDNKKREIVKDILSLYLKRNPVIAENKSAKITNQCVLQKNIFRKNSYTCTASVENMNSIIGNDYQFKFPAMEKEINIETMEINFRKSVNFNNLRDALSIIKNKIMFRYVQQ